jgi:nitrate reductase NapAB chaperone NapD
LGKQQQIQMKVLFDFQDVLAVVLVYDVQELEVNPTKAQRTTMVDSIKICGEA